MDLRAMLLMILGVLSALFIILIHDKIILDPGSFSYLIAITRIPAFFLFAGTVLAPLLVGPHLVKRTFYYTALFLVPSLIPQAFHILSFVFFPDFITPNHRDKVSWLHTTFVAYTLLGITFGIFHKRGTAPYPKFFALLLSSLAVSFFIVLYYPLLPKTYIKGLGSTIFSDVFWAGLSLWNFWLSYLLLKKKVYGEKVSKYLSLGVFFYGIGNALPIFYTHFRDIIWVAVSFYRALAYVLFAYGVIKTEIVDVGKDILRRSRLFLSSLAKAVPRWEGDVLKVALGNSFEEGCIKSLCIYDLRTKELRAYFYGLKEREEDLKPSEDWDKLLEKKVGFTKDGRGFRVEEGYLLLGRVHADIDNPLIITHITNIESHLFSYFLQHKNHEELLKEKLRKIEILQTMLETSEYVVQAYNNIETFSKQVLDRLDYVLGMDGSIFYMFNKGSETLEKLVLSTNFIKTFQKEEARIFAHNVITSSDIARFEEYAIFVKFEQDSYQAGIIGLRKVRTFEKDDFLFLKTIANQLFHVVRLMKVIEDLEKAQLSVRFLSEYDPLTLLYNRRTFEELLQERIEQSQRTMSVFSLIFIDVDGFKLINDTYGYSMGDMALRFLASAIKENLRRVDIACRLGGDEFAVLLLSDKHTAKNVADRIIRNIKENPLEVDGKKISLSVSAVIISYPHDGYSVEDLISTGELLMRDVKRQGKGTVFVSEEETKREVEIVRGFEKTLLEGLHEEAVVPYLQEIVDVKSGKLYAFEGLMRLKFEGRLLSAGEFIPTAERLGLMQKLDLLLAEKVFKEYGRFGGEDILLFFNMVPENANEEFMELIKAKADEYSVPTDRLVFEITERSAVQDILSMSEFVREFKGLGFKFAIDDFGSGYASFYYLKYLPVNYLKIDGEFIKSLPRSPTDTAFVKAIVNVARELGIKTVAEFVEDESILQTVKELGIDYAQGYYIGKPESLEDKIRKFFSKG